MGISVLGRILGDELAAEGTVEDGTAEGGRAALRALDRGVGRVDCRDLLLDARDDPALIVELRRYLSE